MMAILMNLGGNVYGQNVDSDTLELTTAKVALVEEGGTPCHVATSYFIFKVLKHMSGPMVAKGALISTMNLTGYINGDANKIRQELRRGENTDEVTDTELIINFSYNPEPTFSPSEYPRLCGNSKDYFDYGISYLRWAVEETRYYDMLSLDAFLESKFKTRFHLMAERDGKFVFEHEGKKMIAFKMYQEWELAEIR